MSNAGNDFMKGTGYPDYSTVDLVLRVPEPPYELPVKEGAEGHQAAGPKKVQAAKAGKARNDSLGYRELGAARVLLPVGNRP